MFVPGFKRGYAIVPIPQRFGETEDQRREIVQSTLQKVRRANVMLGVTLFRGTPSYGCPCHSRQRGGKRPDWRARSRHAGDGGEVEFPTGSVWYNQQRLSSATLEMPNQAEWVKLDKMAAWQPRKEELR